MRISDWRSDVCSSALKNLERGVDVRIASPGRLLDLVESGKVLRSDVKILVIDEADRMLDMGFIPDVERIVSLLPKIRQTLFFSATMPPSQRSEEHTSELQSLMRISYAVFCLKKKTTQFNHTLLNSKSNTIHHLTKSHQNQHKV